MNRYGTRYLRLDFAVAFTVLIPFCTVGLEFRHSLVAQAIGISSVILAMAPSALTSAGLLERVRQIPSRLAIGLVLYSSATALGVLIGLVNGHDLYRVAAQALSMGLLPLAALIALIDPEEPILHRFRVGLFAGIIIGCLIQLGWELLLSLADKPPSRLFLPNSVSVVGASLLTLAVALTSVYHRHDLTRRLARLSVVLLVIVITGSGLRSLWLLAPLTVIGSVFLWRGRDKRTLLVVFGSILLFAGIAVSSVIGFTVWVRHQHQDTLNLSPSELFSNAGEFRKGVLELELPAGQDLELTSSELNLSNQVPGWILRIRGRTQNQRSVVVNLCFLDRSGKELGRIAARVRAVQTKSVTNAQGATPEGTSAIKLVVVSEGDVQGRLFLGRIKCIPVHSALATRLAQYAVGTFDRVASLLGTLRTGDVQQDATLAFRWLEAGRIIESISDSGWIERLFGHGLGATVHLDVFGYDNRGNWVYFGDENYLHNWYLFLVFKLGILGAFLVLGAVASWLTFTIGKLRSAHLMSDRAFPAAATAAWVAYLIWSMTSPEILDFRVAPLWGWLLAATAASGRER
ncbi:MAG: hypothetical protein K8R59_12850 [Thermoanaerobaculales bacterium]|nr:hypothetical protein [Thermoanaerobaculales bacterium]